MARVECEVEYVQIGRSRRDGVRVTCTECGHSEESFGTGAGSVRRCIMLLKENCPEGGGNFYVADEAED